MKRKNMHPFIVLITDAMHSDILTKQQMKTIKGQWKSGDTDGAVKGYNKLLRRKQEAAIKTD